MKKNILYKILFNLIFVLLNIIIKLIELFDENKNFQYNIKNLFFKYRDLKLDLNKNESNQNNIEIPVITYHKIVSDWEKQKLKYRHNILALPKSKFKIQMKYLKKKGYKTLNCTELYLWHQGKIKLHFFHNANSSKENNDFFY